MEKEFFPKEYKYYRLPETDISFRAVPAEAGFDVTLCADDYAFFVLAELKDIRCRFSDNLLTLYPGKAVTLHAETEREISLEEFVERFEINDLRNSY